MLLTQKWNLARLCRYRLDSPPAGSFNFRVRFGEDQLGRVQREILARFTGLRSVVLFGAGLNDLPRAPSSGWLNAA
jgi:hypothetical protein